MIWFSIIILSVAQIALAISFFRFRRSVKTLFLKIQTYNDFQDIDIDILKKRLSDLNNFLNTILFKYSP